LVPVLRYWRGRGLGTGPLPKTPGSVRKDRGFTFHPSDVESTLLQPHGGATQRTGCINPVPDRMTPARPRVRVARSAGDGLPAASGVRRVPVHLHARKGRCQLRTGSRLCPARARLGVIRYRVNGVDIRTPLTYIRE
jgi:hypothetical protein